jgi:hypothetical protein
MSIAISSLPRWRAHRGARHGRGASFDYALRAPLRMRNIEVEGARDAARRRAYRVLI